jgi:uncharacterized protein (TIGR03086 family)
MGCGSAEDLMGMGIATRFETVADGFSRRVHGVPAGGWEQPAPCEGWVARDVVRHLVEWMPAFLFNFAGADLPPGPSPDEDPARAWEHLRGGLRSILHDPDEAAREIDGPAGPTTVEGAIDQFILGDVLVHTWDLARATGQDETLDPGEVERMLAGLESIPEEVLVSSGHYGPRVAVPDDADPQTRLIAITGRDPSR